MTALLRLMLIASAAGVLAAAGFQISALLGLAPSAAIAYKALTGIMVAAWFFAVFLIIRVGRSTSVPQPAKFLLSQMPGPLKVVVAGLFAYMFITAIVASGTGDNTIVLGKALSPSKLRIASAAWMSLYSISFGVLLVVYRKPSLLLGRHCPVGHPVRPTDSYCATCGAPMGTTRAGA